MGFEWSSKHVLCLNFRNEFLSAGQTPADKTVVQTEPGSAGFRDFVYLGRGPFWTISEHTKAAKEFALDDKGEWRIAEKSGSSRSKVVDAFVWGWWRKRWEQHLAVFSAIRKYLYPLDLLTQETRQRKPDNVGVILYCAATLEMYRANLLDIQYAQPGQYIAPSAAWADACPVYYREDERRCGAILLLESPPTPVEKPDDELRKFVVHPVTFQEILPHDPKYTEFLPHESTREFFEIAWNQPTRANLRATEKTLWVLQEQSSARLMESWGHELMGVARGQEQSCDSDLANTLPARNMSQALSALRESGFHKIWPRLSEFPAVLGRIIDVRQPDEPEFVSALDLHLLSRWIATETTGKREQRDVNDALIRWATEPDYERKSKAAKAVFGQVWKAYCARYEVTEASLREYLAFLPDFETLLSVAKHGLGHRISKDHLSHNVRAALLTTFLLEEIAKTDDKVAKLIEADSFDARAAAFYGGLFHDIAYIVQEAKTIFSNIVRAISGLVVCSGAASSGMEVNEDLYQRLLMYVLLVCSLPSLHERVATPEALKQLHYEQLQGPVYRDYAKEAFLDLTFSTIGRSHGVLGAVALLAISAGLDPADKWPEIREKMQGFFLRVCDPTAPCKEVLLIAQAIALHDQNTPARFSSSVHMSQIVPHALLLSTFPVAFAVRLADELQDWGRPVGPRGMCAIRDAKIETGPRHLDVHYRMTDRTEAFHGTDYSLLEHAVGKLLALSSISIGDPPGDSSARVQFEGPGPFHLVYSPHNARLDEILEPEMQIVGKISRDTIQDSPRKEKVSLTEDDLLIAVKRNDAVANDFLFVSKGKTQIGNLSWDFFDSICFDPTAVRITHRQEHLVLEKPTYMRGRSADALKNAFRRTGGVSDTCSLILFEAARIEKHQEAADISVREALSSAPEANFLDLDWRFSPDTCERVCKAVVQIAEKWFGSDNLQICYLACPSLAVWHNNFFSSIDFKLLDRGHAAIQYWKEHHYLPNDAMRVRDYDVRDPVPKDLRNTFHVVVLDPPWYDEYYGRFLARTLELLREPFGIVGIAEYPAYDFAKQQRFALARGAILALDKPVLTMDIWYETPPFDRFVPESWAFRAGAKYRPSYLEFYKCADGSSKPPKTELPPPHYFFPVSKGTLSVNFNSKLVDQNSMNLRAPGSLFAYRYKSLERPTQPDLAKTLAWTSSNLVVRVEKSKKAAYERLAEEIRATGNVLDFICELEKQYP